MVEFPRLHPAGNAGVRIANIDPVNKGEVVLTLDIVTLVRIGSLALTGKPDWTVEVAVTGSEVEHPQVVTAVAGAEMTALVGGNVKDDGRHHRVISGNVLTGVPVGEDGFLRYPYRQVTVIPEGDDADEFMGWASMSPSKMSVSPSFIGRFLRRKFSPDARLNGGRRAMIMSGEYDKVFPMDILPEYPVKAILAKDIDRMEARASMRWLRKISLLPNMSIRRSWNFRKLSARVLTISETKSDDCFRFNISTMKALRNYLNRIKPNFEPDGKLHAFRSVFDGFETFLYTPNSTSTSGSQYP